MSSPLDIENSWLSGATLHEPVSFEEYIMEPMLPERLSENDTPVIINPLFLQKDTFSHVLDENEQKSFSSFLDSFLTDEASTSGSSWTDESSSHRPTSPSTPTSPPQKRTAEELPKAKKARVSTKELLTEDEKRANHISSEQKRRSMIRNGFKELTELVPGLVNSNHSKSTILFKSAELIRRTEEKNKALQEKVDALKLRVKMEHRDTLETQNKLDKNSFQELPLRTRNALLAHKAQERQLLLLQKQIHMHQVAQKQSLPLPYSSFLQDTSSKAVHSSSLSLF
ncbi:hypothetical protein BY458DRAFT_552745 [Sporodiniella umbellata]|nr:hypothetical protein BY458DRAFT_552745 [Sporodiniella umbellata]